MVLTQLNGFEHELTWQLVLSPDLAFWLNKSKSLNVIFLRHSLVDLLVCFGLQNDQWAVKIVQKFTDRAHTAQADRSRIGTKVQKITQTDIIQTNVTHLEPTV